jgi:two-component system, response regulator
MKEYEIFDILIVEDNPSDAELMIRALRKGNIANPLHVVEDGAEALDFIFARGQYSDRMGIKLPRVVLLDIKLPKVNGLEVLKAIKENENTKNIPVVIVTSSREDPDIRIAYSLGANSYVVKPVDSAAFMNAMNHIGLYWLLVNQPPI